MTSILFFIAVGSTGCIFLFPEPENPDPDLTKKEAKALVNCQDVINRAGREFVAVKMERLERCVQDILALRTAAENGHIRSEEEYDTKLDKVRDSCDQRFANITRQSTKFVDSVVDACTPVEDLILGEWDLLSFQILGENSEGPFGDIETVEDLAGALCTTKELAVDHMVFAQMPRLLELLTSLGGEYVEIVEGGGEFPRGLPVIPLDERCPTEEIEVPSGVLN